MKIFSKIVLILICACLAISAFASCNIDINGYSSGTDDKSQTGGNNNQTQGAPESGGNSGTGTGGNATSGGNTSSGGNEGSNGTTDSGNSGSESGNPGSDGGFDLPDVPVLQYFDITFVYNNGQKDYVRTYKSDNVYAPSSDPERENYYFVGWCKDEKCTEFFDFDTTLTENITLYAKWSFDYSKLNDKVTREAMKANVKVTTDFRLVNSNSVDIMQGSGVIFHREVSDNFITHYVLTNNHVVDYTKQYYSREFKVYDYTGTSYSANIIAADAAYDLAVVKFQTPASKPLAAAKIQPGVPDYEQIVIGLGSPQGQFNAISYGKVMAFQILDLGGKGDSVNSISFEVIYHSAYSNHGSSGGALLNTDLNIVGINYASGSDTEGNFTEGFAVGADKVIEFLSANGITYVLSDGTVVTPTVDDNAA